MGSCQAGIERCRSHPSWVTAADRPARLSGAILGWSVMGWAAGVQPPGSPDVAEGHPKGRLLEKSILFWTSVERKILSFYGRNIGT
jgi:hypothetical protein